MRTLHSFHHRMHSIAISGFLLGLSFGIIGTTAGASVLGSHVFDDVPANAYYDAAVGELYERGVIKGYDADTFGPDDAVTRAQVAVMMKRLRDDLLQGGAVASARSSSVSSVGSSASVYVNPRGTFQFTTASFSVREGSGNAALTMTRLNGQTGEITVRYTITGGTAVRGSDFTGDTGTVVFADKQTSKVLTVDILNDAIVESDETFTVTVTDVGRAAIGTPSVATVTIVNDDGTSSASTASNRSASSAGTTVSLSLAAATYGITEAGGTLTVSVQRTGGTSGTVGVTYGTTGGTATANSDYATTNGTLTFASGETTKSIAIPIMDNGSIQGNKTFNIILSSPTGGAVLGEQKSAVVSIIDDENESLHFGSGSVKFMKSEYVVDEEERVAFITVQRIGGTKGTVSMTVSTSDMTAFSTLDYTNVSSTLTFLPFEASKVFTIPVVEDSTNEEDEYFTVSIGNLTAGIELLSPGTTSVTIVD